MLVRVGLGLVGVGPGLVAHLKHVDGAVGDELAEAVARVLVLASRREHAHRRDRRVLLLVVVVGVKVRVRVGVGGRAEDRG